MTMELFRSVPLALALLGIASRGSQGASPIQGPSDVDFAAFGAEFTSEHCAEAASKPCALEDVLAQGFARLDVGPFVVECPRAMLAQKELLARLQRVLQGLGEATATWLDWQGALGEEERLAAETWSHWIGGWKPLKAAKADEARELLDAFAADEAERAAGARLVSVCDDAERLALVVPEGRQQRLILAPSRLEFIRWVGYAGLADEAAKAQNWLPDTHQWAQFWLGWDLVLALEYSPWTGFDPTFRSGQAMERIGKGVVAEHVVQQGSVALLRATRPTLPETRYDSALAMLLTIASVGEINTIEGAGGVGTSGGRTNPYSRFVPGGNPDGGTLPPRSAAALDGIVESRWRKGHGADGFALPLKVGQAEGAKATKRQKDADPLAHFVLHKEDGTGEHVIHAPFFGPHADAQRYPPGDYLVDYAEFYRAYKAAFFHWLATHGPDAEAAPEARVAKWRAAVRGLATLSEERTLDALVEEVYGLPISGKDGSADSLEWRFLKALSKLK
jgi:hypothetical protein